MQPDNQFKPQSPIQPPQPVTPPAPAPMPPQPAPMPPQPAAAPAPQSPIAPNTPPVAPAPPTIQPSSYQPVTPPAPAPMPPQPAPMPPQPAAAPQMTMAQPAPTTGGAMPAAAPQPSYQSATSQSSSGSGLGIAALVTALLPLIGIVLGILSVVKGSKTQNKKLKGMGIAAIILSVVMLGVYYFALPALVSGLLGNNYSKTQEISATGTGYSYKITIPEAFKPVTADTSSDEPNPSSFLKQEDRKVYAIYKNAEESKGLIALFGYQITDMSSLARLAKSYGQEITPESIIKEVLKDTAKIKTDIKNEKVFQGKVNNIEVGTVKQDGNGIIVSFTAKSETTDGKPADVVGELAFYLNKDLVLIDTITFAKKEAWDANTEVFQGINKSISTQVNGSSVN